MEGGSDGTVVDWSDGAVGNPDAEGVDVDPEAGAGVRAGD